MRHVSLLRLRCRLTAALSDRETAGDVMLLDRQESETYQRFLVHEDRRDYAAAHALLRRTLTRLEPSHAPEAWSFVRTAHGKPRLSQTTVDGSPVRFSLTHTRGCVACAISRDAEVGIDAECRSHIDDLERLLAGVCSAGEQAQVRAAPASARTALFLDLWALKEAYLKARGTGLAAKLPSIGFDLRVQAMIMASFTPDTATAWWFGLFRPSVESRIAIAIAPACGTELMLDAAVVRLDGFSTSMQPVRASGPFRLAPATTGA
jgi:4'-phosphopantetheinyl transferase